ncbi:MAG: hypothetical protein U1E10_04035 [Bdellovibrionales bacterium]|nr:hypothetical protein [Bdellovibrionales bacterium]
MPSNDRNHPDYQPDLQPAPETASETRARRSIHVVGAVIVLLTMVGVIWGVTGGAGWAKQRQLKAIQVAVRADLDLVFQAQQKFYKEHGFYTTDLKALELWPKRVLYAFGFVKAASFKEATDGVTSSSMGDSKWNPEMRTIAMLAAQRSQDAIDKAKSDPGYKPDAPIILSPMTQVKSIDFDRLISFCPDCTATKTTFKMVAAANLDSDPVLDVWTIDQTGAVQHLIDDLK